MLRKTFLKTALIGCLLGAALSYFSYQIECSRLQQSYGPVIDDIVEFKKKHTDAQGFWYNADEGQNLNRRSHKVLNLIRRGEQLAFQLWLYEYLVGYCITGMLVSLLIVYAVQKANSGKRIVMTGSD